MGQVYLIQAGSTNLYKVGYTSKTPEERRAALQTGNPYPLEVVTAWQGSQEDERRLHSLLDPYRREGEWFELTIASLLALLARYDVLSETAQTRGPEPLSDDQLWEQIKKDILDFYWEYGPGVWAPENFQHSRLSVEISKGYQELLRMGYLRCRLWRWYAEDTLCATLPFDRHERYHGTNCFDHCLDQGYIQQGDEGYRVDPLLSQDGYEFFQELAIVDEDAF